MVKAKGYRRGILTCAATAVVIVVVVAARGTQSNKIALYRLGALFLTETKSLNHAESILQTSNRKNAHLFTAP